MSAATAPVHPGIQLRLDVKGWALPIRPELLAYLDEFERSHIAMCLRLDDEQTRCARRRSSLSVTAPTPRARGSRCNDALLRRQGGRPAGERGGT